MGPSSWSVPQEADVYLPDNVDLRGDCDEDYASLSMTFKGFDLKIFFRKVGGFNFIVNLPFDLISHPARLPFRRLPEVSGGTWRAWT